MLLFGGQVGPLFCPISIGLSLVYVTPQTLRTDISDQFPATLEALVLLCYVMLRYVMLCYVNLSTVGLHLRPSYQSMLFYFFLP